MQRTLPRCVIRSGLQIRVRINGSGFFPRATLAQVWVFCAPRELPAFEWGAALAELLVAFGLELRTRPAASLLGRGRVAVFLLLHHLLDVVHLLRFFVRQPDFSQALLVLIVQFQQLSGLPVFEFLFALLLEFAALLALLSAHFGAHVLGYFLRLLSHLQEQSYSKEVGRCKVLTCSSLINLLLSNSSLEGSAHLQLVTIFPRVTLMGLPVTVTLIDIFDG